MSGWSDSGWGPILERPPTQIHTYPYADQKNHREGEIDGIGGIERGRKKYFLLKLWLSTLGGRTAWTTLVIIKPILCIWAKFSYEVTYVNNAREDAAECALQHLRGIHPAGCDCGSSYFITGNYANLSDRR